MESENVDENGSYYVQVISSMPTLFMTANTKSEITSTIGPYHNKFLAYLSYNK